MIKKVFRAVLTCLGVGGGVAIAGVVTNYMRDNGHFGMNASVVIWLAAATYIILGVAIGAIAFVIAPAVINSFIKLIRRIENRLSTMPITDLFFCLLGLIIGLVIAYLLSRLILSIPGRYLSLLVNFVSYVTFCCLGIVVMLKRKNDITIPTWLKRNRDKKEHAEALSQKVLDTSAIIDGRISDICKTGFVEGTLLIPSFVLDELRHISDSADALKRNRGRRGLDILQQMQDDAKVNIRIEDKDYDDLTEVDAKLLRLAAEVGGVVITTDYNLNKVAAVQRVPVLNINDLANAIKTVLLPGEELSVSVIKEGKEYGQGLAYLADGTMIVIDGGKQYVGSEVRLNVTSVLQTSAGRMVFAKMVQ